MKQTDSVQFEGAELVFDTQGAGQPLIFIPGAGGDSFAFGRVARLLADEFFVITYDRRANARSSGDKTVELDMAQQARDAVAVLRAAGHERGIVFGNSAGANIAMNVVTDHPKNVLALVAHEPPAVKLLPDAKELLIFVDQVYETFLAQGASAALQLFAGSMVGFEDAGTRPGNLEHEEDFTFFFAKEYLNVTRFVPDLDAIRDTNVPVALLAGARSGDAYYARTAPIIAERLGCPCVVVPGNHLGFLFEPELFAPALRNILLRISDGQ